MGKTFFYIFTTTCVILSSNLAPFLPESHANTNAFTSICSAIKGSFTSGIINIEKFGYIFFILFILISALTTMILLKNFLSFKKVFRSKKSDWLYQDETFIKAVINSAPIAIVALNNNRIAVTNNVFNTITGYKNGELRGKNLMELFPSNDEYKSYLFKMNSHNNASSPISLETKWKCKSGNIIDVMIGTDSVIESNFLPRQIITAMDISLRKQGEKEREELINMLEIQNAELEQYTYTASHDLKAPLITIEGFLEILKDEESLKKREQIVSYINRMDSAVKKMRCLLDDLLEIFKVGRLINQPEKILFEDLINTTLKLFEKQIKDKNIVINRQNEYPEIYGDYDRLLVVMINLIDNAIKFIGTDNERPVIEIGAHSVNNSTVFYVKDNGVGIEPKYHQKYSDCSINFKLTKKEQE